MEVHPLSADNGDVNNDGNKMNRLASLRTKPLTPKQERRLVAYLDEQFLQLTRGYKKRTSPTTHVPTLHTYITEARKLLKFILQIPPVDPSTELRTQFMLRLTGDCLGAIVGYGLVYPRRQWFDTGGVSEERGEENGVSEERREGAETEERTVERRGEEEDEEEPRDYTSALRELLDWLDDLDQAWIAVLQSQVWDPDMGEGVDLVVALTNADATNGETSISNGNHIPPLTIKSTPTSQTDVTRLRSLLITSIANLEEWLSRTKPPSMTTLPSRNDGSLEGGGDDVAAMLERLGLLDEFDDLFSRTMDYLGGYSGGGIIVEPETIVQDGMEMDEEDMSDMIEVVMDGCS